MKFTQSLSKMAAQVSKTLSLLPKTLFLLSKTLFLISKTLSFLFFFNLKLSHVFLTILSCYFRYYDSWFSSSPLKM